jgi:Glycosyl transferases group 1
VDLGPVTNGGALCCQNHVRRLAVDPAIDLHVIVTGFEAARQGNHEFVQSLGVPFHFIAFRELSELDLSGAQYDPQQGHLFPWERTALIQLHVSLRLVEIIASIVPSAIIIDYVPSTLFAMPILEGSTPCLVITLANEDKFFRDVCANGGSTEWVGTELAQQRHLKFERRIYSLAKTVVAFRSSDIWDYEDSRHKYHVVSPVFPDAGARWLHDGSHTIFFVGNRGHFPNRIAIDWLCAQLAPALLRLDSSILIRIIGANVGDNPMYAEATNIEFMGVADRAAVIREFSRCALFVAPMAIDYGCEIKLQECVSHAMPFLATQAALDGLPPLPFVPVLNLGDPEGAANQIKNLLDDPAKLTEMSIGIEERIGAERELQRTLWGKIIADMIKTDTGLRVT